MRSPLRCLLLTTAARRTMSCSGGRKSGGTPFLKLADQRNHVLAEILDLFLEMQEAEQDQARARVLKGEDALRNLVRRADEVRAEPVVVLNQIVECRFGPVPLPLRRGFAGILDLVGEGVDGLGIGLADNVRK